MIEVRQTDIFANWFNKLRDRKAKARIDRIEIGNFGDVAPIGEDVSELRMHYGSGYRVYFIQRGLVVVILIPGGDKGSQNADIKRAKEISKQLED
ncbi:type II toxin-antitoxin system RelE/ParE family toxin [Acaryochloris marina]|uniref:Addiction module toxin, putative n=1 Tax=Acaryochloris marina (strain MBIC 11017) TaxID=329726 RepID=B0C1R4_ACAM1|nr:type II toxin-antitoxin system RelE/ParE family toxin [Acaryochloris marina]ABW26080.1 addiction module toxin, putative [Acaryochloris marina MBIC11017]BDM80920.1 toxin, RelE family protein [Acaryochloris marina MBIC10699]